MPSTGGRPPAVTCRADETMDVHAPGSSVHRGFAPDWRAAAARGHILTNGKIITVDDQFSIAQAVAVRGDRIVAVGTNQDITRLAGPSTRRIDLRGRSVVPGLIDNHAHFQEEGAYWTLELRFDGVDTRKQALELIRAKAKAAGPGKWVFNLGGWSPDQFADDKKPFTRDELDQVAPDNPVFLQFTRSEQYLNSKAIDAHRARAAEGAVDHARREGPGHRHHRRCRAAMRSWTRPSSSTRRTEARPTCRWTSSSPARRSCSAISPRRASRRQAGSACGRTCIGSFSGRGRPACGSSASARRPAGDVAPAHWRSMIAQLATLRYHDGDEWMDNSNYGERFPGGGGGDVIAPGPEPIAAPGGVGRVGPLRARGRQGRHPGPAPHCDGNRHRGTAHAAREGQQGGQPAAAPLVVHAHGRRDPAADRAHEEAQHVHRREPPADRVRRAAPPDPGRQGLRDAADAGDPGQRHHVGVRHRRVRGQSVPPVPDACTSR